MSILKYAAAEVKFLVLLFTLSVGGRGTGLRAKAGSSFLVLSDPRIRLPVSFYSVFSLSPHLESARSVAKPFLQGVLQNGADDIQKRGRRLRGWLDLT